MIAPSTFPMPALVVLFVLLGLGFGSFGNMMLYRVATGRSFTGRSFCPNCTHTLTWTDLFPVLSYVWLGGKCRYCKMPISAQYPLFELATMGAFLFALAMHPADPPYALVEALLLWGLLLMTVYDARFQLIPDLFTFIIFLCALGLLFSSRELLSGALGAAIGCGWFLIQWLLTRGRAVGSGDILLGASLGLWLGWKETITMLFLSYIFGAMWALYLLASDRATRKTRIAFGPLLALGSVIASFGVGELYFRLLGF